jgi:cytochrome P450 family 110
MTDRLPPSSKGAAWRNTWQIVRDPKRALEGWGKTLGDPFLIPTLNGRVVITGRADLIREIFGNDPANYDPFATGALVPILGEGSMLTMGGETHRRERKLVMPMFHGDRMRAYGSAMQEVALEKVNQYLDRSPIVPALELMTGISLEVIVRTVFGVEHRDLSESIMRASREVIRKLNPILFFSRRTHVPFLGLSPWDRFRAARQKLRDIFDAIYEQHKKDGSQGEDILSMMTAARYEDGEPITRDHLREELATFLFAGHETSAIAMTWAIYHLHSHPESLRTLQNELRSLPDRTPASLAASPYLKAVVQESLRLHPIVTEVLRKLRVPMQLGEYSIPAGFAVAPATVLAHYNPTTYTDPDAFRPERFLERNYSPFEYMPFGGGHRRCIGAAFAAYEMAIVLGTLLSEHRWELVDAEPVVPKRRNLTMGPSSNVSIRKV